MLRYGPMTIRRSALTLAVLAHALAVAASQVPRESALGAALQPLVSTYLTVTGTWQSWDMFDAAPRYHAYRVELVAVMPDGSARTFPPMLPELASDATQVRDRTFFIRTISGSMQSYYAGYAQGACDAVERLTGTRPASVRSRQFVEVLRPLEQIRTSGAIADERVADSSAVMCLDAPR
jgi:hypothetical protein